MTDELLRFQTLQCMRKTYQKLCYETFGWSHPPKLSFERWIFETFLDKNKYDHVLPSFQNEINEYTVLYPGLFREIAEDLPIKLSKPLRFCTNDDIENIVEEYTNGIDTLSKLYPDYILGLNLSGIYDIAIITENIKRYSNYLTSLFKPHINKIIHRLIYISQLGIEKINNSEILYNTDFFSLDNSLVIYKFPKIQFSIKIDNTIIQKLKRQYLGNDFDAEVGLLLLRYQFGCTNEINAGLHSAVTPKMLNLFKKLFGVNCECFASPFNNHFEQYYSAFSDTDISFGSLGSFFNSKIKEGSYEANPPFTEEYITYTVDYIIKLLSKSSKPLSFILVLPEWNDSEGWLTANTSEYLRWKLTLEKKRHNYINGNVQVRKREFKAVHNTTLFFLQNERGTEKYFVDKDKIDLLSGF